jgi:isoquinoline 1-oxidoreductase beta subunit
MRTGSINRRDFLKILGTTGTSLLVGIYLGGCDQEEIPEGKSTNTDATEIPAEDTATPVPEINLPAGTLAPNIYLQIDPDGTTTITAFRSEMGQGVRTAIAMILAEELDANWDDIKISQAPADRQYGNQVTGGSASISGSYFQLRMAGAVVRQMLVNAAAGVWEVNPVNCTTESGYVIHPDGDQMLSYGQLAGTASELKIPKTGEFTMKQEGEFRIIGTDVHHWDAPEIIQGKAIFGMDIKLPEMLYATIARSPIFGGRIDSFDDSKTLESPGVVSVQVIDNWIAVIAKNTWAAIKGRQALEVKWKGGNLDLSSETIRTALAENAPQIGSAGENNIEAIYEFPYQAHVTMEPMNCTAHVQGDTCEVWAPTQSPQDVHQAVQSALKLKRDDVTVHVTLMGGGFGRRLQSDYAVEAAKVSQAVGTPVQVFWTREDDIRHDFYHPMSYIYTSGDPDRRKRPSLRSFDGSHYIPTGAWRSVGNHPEAYARECFIDEMAAARDIDPLDLRRELYNSRALAVIELAAEKSGWTDKLLEGRGRGLAYHATFGVTHVAMVAEVEVKDGVVRVQRVVSAVDCGTAINPDNIAAQIEGGVAFGLTAALKGGVTVEGGRILESNFHDCPILQIDEMPEVQVYLIQGTTNPSGMGEMGVPPIAPAVANAVFNATGKRIRHLPILAEDLT